MPSRRTVEARRKVVPVQCEYLAPIYVEAKCPHCRGEVTEARQRCKVRFRGQEYNLAPHHNKHRAMEGTECVVCRRNVCTHHCSVEFQNSYGQRVCFDCAKGYIPSKHFGEPEYA